MKKFDLVFNIGNTTVSGAFISEEDVEERFSLKNPQKEEIQNILQQKEIGDVFISSDCKHHRSLVLNVLENVGKKPYFIDYEKLSIKLDVEKPEEVGQDRIANIYGALSLHPHTNCIVIDLGTAVTFDVIGKERVFLGGAIYPGPEISAKALAKHTEKLPLVEIEKPSSCLSKSTEGNIQSGIYYGLIGTIQRICEEIISTRFASSNVIVVATGGFTEAMEEGHPYFQDMEEDLGNVVDYFEPDLTFIGLHQLLKERRKND